MQAISLYLRLSPHKVWLCTFASFPLFPVDKKTCYIFLVPSLAGDATGFMPFKGQFGFVKSSEKPFHTIAHELGHGPFRLRHTFSNNLFVAGQGQTDNLMDYSRGERLYKHQWDLVHDPETMLFAWAEDEGEQMWVSDKEFAIKFLEDLKYAYCNRTKYTLKHGNYQVKDIALSGGIVCKSISIKIFENYTLDFGAKLPQTNTYLYSLPLNQPFNGTTSFKVIKSNAEQSIGGQSKPEILYLSVEVDEKSAPVLNQYLNNCNLQQTTDEYIEILTKQYETGKCKATDLLDKLPDYVYPHIPDQLRFDLIRCKADEVRVAGDDERIIIRLLESIPPSSCANILKLFENDNTGILAKLHSAIDNTELTEYYRALNNLYYNGKGAAFITQSKQYLAPDKNVAYTKGELADTKKIFFWQNPGLAKRFFNIFNYESAKYFYKNCTLNKTNQLSFDYDFSLGQASYYESYPISINSFSLIRLDVLGYSEKLDAVKNNLETAGKSYYIPAFNIMLLQNEQFKTDLFDNLNIAVIIGTAGSGVLAQGGKSLIIGGSEILLATTMMTVESYRGDLSKTAAGREFLDAYDAFMMVYVAGQGVKIAAGLPGAFAKMKTAWQKYGKSVSAIDTEIAMLEKQVAAGIDDFLKQYNLKETQIEMLLGKAANAKGEIFEILKSWENSSKLYSLLNNNLTRFPKLADEMLANPKLFSYFEKINSNWYSVLGVRRQILQGKLTSPAFNEMIGEIEITYAKGTKAKLKTIVLDDAQGVHLGDVFDSYMEEYVSLYWRNKDKSNLPAVIADRLDGLRSNGYELVIKPKVSIGGKTPEPDMLFVKIRDGRPDFNDCVYIDNKYSLTSGFSSGQNQIIIDFGFYPNRPWAEVNGVGYLTFVNGLRPNASNILLKIKEIQTFSINDNLLIEIKQIK